MKNIFKILITLLLFITKQGVYAQAGTPDLSFGVGGLVIENTYNGYGYSTILTDGKILMVGSYIGICIDRFNPDGSYDESFGIDGRSNIILNNKLFGPLNQTFALLDNGKIVSTAKYYPKGIFGNKLDVAIVRINSNGTLDSSFGINGLDTLELDNFTNATGLVVQPDGKIVVSGDVGKNEYDEKRTFICRYMPDGGLDPTFGEEGIVITTYTYATNSNSLVINSAGKLIRGSTYDKYDFHSAYMLESFNPDGSRDESFGENGVAKYVFGEGQSGEWFTIMEGASIQADDKIVCFGESGKDYLHIAICRFNANGTIDQDFGENGSLIVPYKNQLYVGILGCDIQPDGKILTVGGGADEPFNALIVVRYLANGQLDPGFGENGIVSIINDTANMSACSVHYLADGKILTTGRLYTGSHAYTVLARFNGDNVLASNFKEVKAIQENDNITITWQTLNENNTKSYTVERSSNAKDYAGISTIPAKHAATNSYSYTDRNPLYGDNYYRIKENAANGTFIYSQTLKVMFENSSKISLYPNPAKNTVTIKGLDKNATAVIKITDMNGREISKQNFSNTSSTILSIKALAQGSYFILVEQNGKVTKLRLVKE